MADDMLDIEEHDVMENPIIKKIFPDLSILKKEIIDYNDEIQEELLHSETYNLDGADNILHGNSSSSNSHKLLDTKTVSDNKNKLNLTRHRNITPIKRKIKCDSIYNAKVYLQNIRPELIRSQKFCQKCLILFSERETFINHQIFCHTDHGKDCLQEIGDLINSTEQHKITNDVHLRRHINNYDIISTNEVESPSQNKISDIDVMFKLNEPNVKSTSNNLIKPCFHCSVVFPSQQSLIDHLYNVLNNKNSNFQSIKTKIDQDIIVCKNNIILQNDSIDCSQTKRLYYCCPICSYYFISKKLCKSHLFRKHYESKKINIEYVKFCSKCKFCHLNCNGVSSYNKHLRENHVDEMLNYKNNDFFSLNKNQVNHTKNKTCDNDPKRQTDVFERNLKIIAEHSKIHEDKIFEKRVSDVRIMAFKGTLFKCIECSIHFVTSEAAINHFEHSELLLHWKCINCQRLFKQQHQNLHEKQHKYSNYFSVVEVNNNPRELNKCPKCAVCFRKQNLSDHCNCEPEQFETYSILCDIIKEHDQEALNERKNDLRHDIGSNPSEVTADDQNMLTSFCSKIKCVDEVLYLYTCKNCDISVNNYDDVVKHCHSHTHLNKIEIDALDVCTICNVQFISSSYHHHKQLHFNYSKKKFKYFNFDVLYFNANNDEWLEHVFGTLSKDTISRIIEKCIYKYENKITMEIIQHGPYELTMYKCDKCKSFIDGKTTYEHILNCNVNSVKFYCKMCNIPFVSNISRIEHEKNHLCLKTTLKSYRIVTFNREQDNVVNRNVSKTKYYVLFECRYCHVVVDKNIYNKHECNSFACKSCNICGLLLQDRDYDMHMLKHKVIESFNKNDMKVVLIGNKIVNKNEIKTSNLISTFSGMVCDYTFYKCVKCNVCVREFRRTMQHNCLIDAATSKCPQCELVFDERKIKGHLKLHDTDPDITKDTIIVKTFGCNELNKKENIEVINISSELCNNDNHEDDVIVPDAAVGHIKEISDGVCIPEIAAKIYKCDCGLHFINETQMKEHLIKCSGVVRANQSRQDCFKCGLKFTSSILFQHLLEHHGGKNNLFKYEIVEN